MAEIKQDLNRRQFLKISGVSFEAFFLNKFIPKAPEAGEKQESAKVDFNFDGVMFVDGKKFFPIVLYGLPGNPAYFGSWEKAKKMGANVITMFFPTERALTFADNLGLKTLVRLDYDHAFGPSYTPNERELARIQKHKSVVGWEIDEPNQYWENKDSLFKLLEWLKPRSDLPLRVTTDGRARMMEYPESKTFLEELYRAYLKIISGPDVYEKGKRVKEEVMSYESYWKGFPEVGVRTVWQVTSAHSEDGQLFDQPLTQQKILYQTVAGIVGGARGIGFYDSPWGYSLDGPVLSASQNGQINSFARHKEDVQKVASLLKSAFPGLVGTVGKFVREGPLSIRITQGADDSTKKYAFCVNDASAERERDNNVRLVVLAGGNFKDLVSGEAVVFDASGKSNLWLGSHNTAILVPS